MKTIEFGYIKSELGGGETIKYFYALERGLFFLHAQSGL